MGVDHTRTVTVATVSRVGHRPSIAAVTINGRGTVSRPATVSRPITARSGRKGRTRQEKQRDYDKVFHLTPSQVESSPCGVYAP